MSETSRPSVEQPRPETIRIQQTAEAIRNPAFAQINQPDARPPGKLWPDVQQENGKPVTRTREQIKTDYLKGSVPLVDHLDQNLNMFLSVLSPAETVNLTTAGVLDTKDGTTTISADPEKRMQLVASLIKQVDTEGMDDMAFMLGQHDIRANDAITCLQALGIDYAEQAIAAIKTKTETTTVRKSRTIKRQGGGRLEISSKFSTKPTELQLSEARSSLFAVDRTSNLKDASGTARNFDRTELEFAKAIRGGKYGEIPTILHQFDDLSHNTVEEQTAIQGRLTRLATRLMENPDSRIAPADQVKLKALLPNLNDPVQFREALSIALPIETWTKNLTNPDPAIRAEAGKNLHGALYEWGQVMFGREGMQRTVEVDLRMAVGLQDVLLPPAVRLERIRLEQQVADTRGNMTSSSEDLDGVMKKLLTYNEGYTQAVAALEAHRQMERRAILRATGVKYENGASVVNDADMTPEAQALADQISTNMDSLRGTSVMAQNRAETAAMLAAAGMTLNEQQLATLNGYLESGAIRSGGKSSEDILTEMGIAKKSDSDPDYHLFQRIIADGRRVGRAVATLGRDGKTDSYAKTEELKIGGTVLDMGLKGVEYLYRQGVTSTITESRETVTEEKTETGKVPAEVPVYDVNESGEATDLLDLLTHIPEPPPEAPPAEAETGVKPPEVEIKPPEVEVKPPEAEAKPPEAEVKPPETEAKPPELEVKPPESEAPPAEAETGIKPPTKEKGGKPEAKKTEPVVYSLKGQADFFYPPGTPRRQQGEVPGIRQEHFADGRQNDEFTFSLPEHRGNRTIPHFARINVSTLVRNPDGTFQTEPPIDLGKKGLTNPDGSPVDQHMSRQEWKKVKRILETLGPDKTHGRKNGESLGLYERLPKPPPPVEGEPKEADSPELPPESQPESSEIPPELFTQEPPTEGDRTAAEAASEVKPVETEVKPPETEVKPPEAEVKPPEVEVKPPETEEPAAEAASEVKPPEAEVKPPEVPAEEKTEPLTGLAALTTEALTHSEAPPEEVFEDASDLADAAAILAALKKGKGDAAGAAKWTAVSDAAHQAATDVAPEVPPEQQATGLSERASDMQDLAAGAQELADRQGDGSPWTAVAEETTQRAQELGEAAGVLKTQAETPPPPTRQALEDEYWNIQRMLSQEQPASPNPEEDRRSRDSMLERARALKAQIDAMDAPTELHAAEAASEVKPPEEEVRPVDAEVKPPEVEVKPPEAEVKPPEVEVKPPEVEVKPPETEEPAAEAASEVKPPEAEVKPPEAEVKPPEVEVKPPEAEVKPADDEEEAPPSGGPATGGTSMLSDDQTTPPSAPSGSEPPTTEADATVKPPEAEVKPPEAEVKPPETEVPAAEAETGVKPPEVEVKPPETLSDEEQSRLRQEQDALESKQRQQVDQEQSEARTLADQQDTDRRRAADTTTMDEHRRADDAHTQERTQVLTEELVTSQERSNADLEESQRRGEETKTESDLRAQTDEETSRLRQQADREQSAARVAKDEEEIAQRKTGESEIQPPEVEVKPPEVETPAAEAETGVKPPEAEVKPPEAEVKPPEAEEPAAEAASEVKPPKTEDEGTRMIRRQQEKRRNEAGILLRLRPDQIATNVDAAKIGGDVLYEARQEARRRLHEAHPEIAIDAPTADLPEGDLKDMIMAIEAKEAEKKALTPEPPSVEPPPTPPVEHDTPFHVTEVIPDPTEPPLVKRLATRIGARVSSWLSKALSGMSQMPGGLGTSPIPTDMGGMPHSEPATEMATEVRSPEVEAKPPEAEVKPQEEVKPVEAEVKPPETEVKPPEAEVKPPETPAETPTRVEATAIITMTPEQVRAIPIEQLTMDAISEARVLARKALQKQNPWIQDRTPVEALPDGELKDLILALDAQAEILLPPKQVEPEPLSAPEPIPPQKPRFDWRHPFRSLREMTRPRTNTAPPPEQVQEPHAGEAVTDVKPPETEEPAAEAASEVKPPEEEVRPVDAEVKPPEVEVKPPEAEVKPADDEEEAPPSGGPATGGTSMLSDEKPPQSDDEEEAPPESGPAQGGKSMLNEQK